MSVRQLGLGLTEDSRTIDIRVGLVEVILIKMAPRHWTVIPEDMKHSLNVDTITPYEHLA